MSLGTEVGRGQGDVVLDGVLKRGKAPPPLFGTCLLWPNGWIKMC